MSNASHDSETLAQGQQVITAVAVIWHDFDGEIKVFRPRRADTKKFLPGKFELIGGHIDFGETLEDGLKREIMEEIGMNVQLGDPFSAFTYTNEVKGSHSVQITYFAQFTDPIDNIKLDPDDHSEYRWFSLADIEEHLEKQETKDDEDLQVLKALRILNGTETIKL